MKKKCKSCGIYSTNKPCEGIDNKYDLENCFVCARILNATNIFEKVLNQPNIQGHIRKVKLSVKISK